MWTCSTYVNLAVKQIQWQLVHEKIYPEAYRYTGKATHEVAVYKVAVLPAEWVAELVKAYEEAALQLKATPLLFRIYLSECRRYVKVESYHHGSPHVIVILGLLIALAFLVLLILHEVKEVDWKPLAPWGAATTLLALAAVIYMVSRRERK